MRGDQLVALAPLFTVAAAVVALLLLASARRSRLLSLATTATGLVVALVLLVVSPGPSVSRIGPLLVLDGFGRLFVGLILLATLVVALLGHRELRRRQELAGEELAAEELDLLLLMGALGAAVLVLSRHLVSFFIGLELLSLSLFTLAAYPQGPTHLEAGLKYLVLAGVASSLLLFGMALIYLEVGSLTLGALGAALGGGAGSGGEMRAHLLAGLALLLAGVGFKLGVVPFHMWTLDVYQGAPAPMTAFLATVSKAAVLALLLRWFAGAGLRSQGSVVAALSVVAFASMLVGNLLALGQVRIKRMLAGSSIAHLGYLLVALLGPRALGVEAASYYLLGYVPAVLLLLGSVTLLSREGEELEQLDDYRGLVRRRPGVAAALLLALLSLASLPATAGFVGKLYLVTAGLASGQWALVLVLVLTSVIGLFYYLRWGLALFDRRPAGAGPGPRLDPTGAVRATGADRATASDWAGGALLAVLALVVLALGLYPEPVVRALEALSRAL